MPRKLSIRKLALTMLYIVLMPMIVVIMASTSYQVIQQREYRLQQLQEKMHSTVLPIQNELQRIEKTMNDLLTKNVAARALSVKSSTSQVSINAYVIHTAFDTLFNNSAYLNMMMFYCPNTTIMITKDNGFPNLKAVNKTSIISGIKANYISNVENGILENKEWVLETIGNKVFLRRNMKNDAMYCGCLINLERLIEELEVMNTEGMKFFLIDQTRVVLSSVPEEIGKHYQENKKFNTLVVSENIAQLRLVGVLETAGLSYIMDYFTVFLIVIDIILMIMLIIIILLMRKQFFNPMASLVETMKHIADGDMNERAMDEEAGQELQLVNHTFNQMIESIQQLKIEKYEQELQMRQIQLQYYRAQIRPHFYLNCLKNLYSLAQQDEMNNIEESILLLSNHLRYCFQWYDETVTIRKELEMCKNYIDLMGVTAVYKPKLKLDVEDTFLRASIPPVSLLTLVENSLKYGLTETKQSIISISVRAIRSEEGTYLKVGIYDNGPGFTEEQLKELNSLLNKKDKYGKEHIGIQNVLMRFQLIYNEHFHMAFSNQNGGAVELFIKVEKNSMGEIA